MTDKASSSFRVVPRTGVIYVMAEAAALGYKTDDAKWCNLGQGMPETGPLPGGPKRQTSVAIDPADQEYAPVPGVPEMWPPTMIFAPGCSSRTSRHISRALIKFGGIALIATMS